MKNEYIQELKKILREDLSMEMLNSCYRVFNMLGGEIKTQTEEAFHKMFINKLKESNISLSEDKINQIVKIISWGGGLKLKDIVFVDNTGFHILECPSCVDIGDNDYISYTYSSDRYIYRTFYDITTYFLQDFGISEDDLRKLRDEICKIFVNYFGNCNFSEKLGMDRGSAAYFDRFAISVDKDEMARCLRNKEPFSLSIIGIVNGTTKLVKLDIICDLSKEEFLTVTNVDDKMEYLSDIINKKDKEEGAPEPFSKGAMTYKNKDVKTSNN